ncbi:hypothetical protein [Psychroflexus halocasei]|uniref:Uncharacterized protein n=1 Tax=Psychroflexus halocasei TaxID=908615 RepID=A0A1H4DZ88_9FLAO|nr:hypothetical protein [Psychroflexus halocasei]SEA78115.1 hypothetical protein SAMN05421540_1201 [Psychroflexus halocasei]
MTFYLIILLIFILLIVGLIFWIFRIFKTYKKGNRKSALIQSSILGIILIFISWQLQIFPLSKNFYIKERTEKLTGKSFWSWKEYDYEELGIRGEGYTLDIFKFNDEMAEYFSNPSADFIQKYPPKDLADVKWTETPIKQADIETLNFVTPIYGGWNGEIVERQDFIKTIANEKGGFYAFKKSGGTDFYLISPKRNLIILINHNM